MNLITFKAKDTSEHSLGETTLMVGVYENEPLAPSRFDAVAHKSLSLQTRVEQFRGQHEATMVSYARGDAPVLFFGLGLAGKLTLSRFREALTAAFKCARQLKLKSVVFECPPLSGTDMQDADVGQAVAEYATMVDYEINHFKTAMGGHKPRPHLEAVDLLTGKDSLRAVRSGLRTGQVIGAAVNNTRNLVNLPPSIATPSYLAAEALKLGKLTSGAVQVKVLSQRDCKKLGMNTFLAVARGSSEPPKFIELTYAPANAVGKTVLGLIGKSITFDSGGLDLKPADGMRTMKCDMAGGATVLSAIGAIAALKLPITVKAFMAATENMPGGSAYKPGDVIKTMKGLTVEVDNTDAEGRLTLVDAIEYALRAGATHLVDVATLTGAVSTTLADVAAGMFGNDLWWNGTVKNAATSVDEAVFEMPMLSAFKKGNETPLADMKNSGGKFGAGSSTAALFIAPFAGDTPWVHLDVAGVAFRSREFGVDPSGATGWGVRTLVALARRMSERG